MGTIFVQPFSGVWLPKPLLRCLGYVLRVIVLGQFEDLSILEQVFTLNIIILFLYFSIFSRNWGQIILFFDNLGLLVLFLNFQTSFHVSCPEKKLPSDQYATKPRLVEQCSNDLPSCSDEWPSGFWPSLLQRPFTPNYSIFSVKLYKINQNDKNNDTRDFLTVRFILSMIRKCVLLNNKDYFET